MTVQTALAILALVGATLVENCQATADQLGAIIGNRGGQTITTDTRVADGNTFDAAYNCTNLPTGLPPGWGATCNRHIIGSKPTDGATLRARTGLAGSRGYLQQLEFYIGNSTMAPGGIISVAVGKANSALDFDNPATPIAYRVHLANVSGVLRFQFFLDSDGDEQSWQWSGAVQAQTVYEIYNEYNVRDGVYIGKVNGETVASATLTANNPQTINTLVVGSSGSSAGRDIEFFTDRIIETPIGRASAPPTNVTVTSPANGATNVGISATLECAGSNVNTWEVRYETVNPPVGAYTSLGTVATLGPLILANNTTYFVQCRGTNSVGAAVSSVSSFTTVAATSTGTHPTLLRNATREARWAQMKGDYDSSATNPKCADVGYTTNQKIACHTYKSVLDTANIVTRAENEGLEEAILASTPGNDPAHWCPRAYTRSVASGVLRYASDTAAANDLNVNRELMVDWMLVYDWCYDEWTQTQRDTYLSRMNGLGTGLLVSKYPNGWVCGDVDQPIGNYFGIAAWYAATKTYNPTAVTSWADDDLGGYTATALVCNPETSLSKTARNEIAYYYGAPSAGGAWLEGTEYLTSAFLGLLGCEALRTTDAGNAPCTEIDAWIDDWARYYTHRFSRDYQAIYQSADNQEPHNRWMPYFNNHEGYHYLALSGVLPDGSDRQHLWRQFINFIETNGYGQVFPATYPARGMLLANPYITAAADLSALPQCYPATGSGIYTWNDWTSAAANASQFVTHFKPEGRGLDHKIAYFGDVYLYRKGQFVLTHPYSYAGPAGLFPEGTNTVALEGLNPSPSGLQFVGDQYQDVTGNTCGADYAYVSGTSGGSFFASATFDGTSNYFNPPEHYVDEYTRSVVYLPTTTKTYDTVLVIDRANVKDPEAVLRFIRYTSQPCYLVTCFRGVTNYGYAEQQRIQDYPRWTSFLFQWIDGAPTIVGNKTTWTMPDGQIVEDDWLTPDAVTITSEDTANLLQFGEPTVEECQGCAFFSERKNRTKIEPNTDQQWNVMVRAITARNAGALAPTVTELSVTGDCGAVLIIRPGDDDRIVVWNTAQGDPITQQNPTAAQAAAVLATARMHKAKTCTIPWTQTTTTAKALLLDLAPSLGWTSNLNGAGAQAITEDSGGFEELAVTGTGSQSLVIVGS